MSAEGQSSPGLEFTLRHLFFGNRRHILKKGTTGICFLTYGDVVELRRLKGQFSTNMESVRINR